MPIAVAMFEGCVVLENERLFAFNGDDFSSQQWEAYRLLHDIAHSFDLAVRRRKDRAGRLHHSGLQLFKFLVGVPDIFVDPLPFTIEALSHYMHYNDATIARALKTLEQHGFVKISGTRTARTLLLQVTGTAIETYKRRNDDMPPHLRGEDVERLHVGMTVPEAISLLSKDRQIAGRRKSPIFDVCDDSAGEW
jgi:DNA-binding MarR family transcriptional regulator